MPQIDVSELLGDPDLCQPLVIERRTETMGNNGRVTHGKEIVTPKPFGVVLAGPARLNRGSDEEHADNVIEVHTRWPLRGPASDVHPDVVIYKGNRYVVSSVEDYTDYGIGFVSVVATSMDSMDNPPP